MEIKSAVIPVAGRGTRFYPVTKVVAKELLPLVDTPILHHIVKEAAASGIQRIILITSKGKTHLEDYLDTEFDDEDLKRIDVISVRQGAPKGLGHAILCARPIVGNEPFAVLLGDDVIDAEVPVTKQLIDVFYKNGGAPVVGVMEVDKEDTSKYGIVGGKPSGTNTLLLDTLVEKPKPEKAPSNLAIPGRYILTPDIFDYLASAAPSVNGEIQLTDSLQTLANNRKMYAYKFEGQRFDAGDKFGYLEANLHFALKRPEIHDRAVKLIKKLAKDFGG